MVFTRNLHFVSNNIGSDVTLLLTFDDLESNPKLFRDCYPVCFKVIGFGAEGEHEATVEYQSQMAFIKPQVNAKDIVSSATYVKIDPGQRTELHISSKGPPATFKFTPPVDTPGDTGLATVVNKIGNKCEVGVAFVNEDGSRNVSMLFKEGDFGHENVLAAQFTPVLRGYITSTYQQNQVIRAAIETKCMFKQDLNLLNSNSTWTISRDGAGAYFIKQTR